MFVQSQVTISATVGKGCGSCNKISHLYTRARRSQLGEDEPRPGYASEGSPACAD